MATIDDLSRSVSEMNDEELIERLRELRLSRRTHKGPARKTPTKKKPSMTPEQAQALIAELEGMMKE